MANFFDETEGANIETNTQEAREILEKTQLESDESIISLDIKSLSANFFPKETVEIAMRRLYEQTNPPELSCKTMKKLLNMAKSKVHFKCTRTKYVKERRFSSGRVSRKIIGQFWLKEHESELMKEEVKSTLLKEDNDGGCTKGVKCETCLI